MADLSKRLVTQELVRLRWGYRKRLIHYGIAKGTLSISCHEELTETELKRTVSFLGDLIEMVMDMDDGCCDGLRSTKRKPFIEK